MVLSENTKRSQNGCQSTGHRSTGQLSLKGGVQGRTLSSVPPTAPHLRCVSTCHFALLVNTFGLDTNRYHSTQLASLLPTLLCLLRLYFKSRALPAAALLYAVVLRKEMLNRCAHLLLLSKLANLLQVPYSDVFRVSYSPLTRKSLHILVLVHPCCCLSRRHLKLLPLSLFLTQHVTSYSHSSLLILTH